ncbi:MAG: diaminopimelate decarboxylase [Clostridiales bacterium]|nr:diaminopimelate decarboxylase [Clostridiales bacterium]
MENNTFNVNDGELYIEGVRATELAERFGTPLYVLSESLIRSRCAEVRAEFLEKHNGSFATYAGKAFLTPAICRIADEEGFHLDVVSAGEFYTAMKAGFPAERVIYHGNNKTYDELDEAIGAGLGRIVIDGLDELDIVEEIAAKHGRVQTALFRITPEVKVDTHIHITTGQRDSKFGIPVDEHILYPLVEKAINSPHIDFKGLHYHIGSQLFDADPYIKATDKVLETASEIYNRFDYAISELIIGGGFGIRYTDEERKPYSYFLDPVMQRVGEFCERRGIQPIGIGIEPGRSIVGDAGATLYTVGTIKRIPGGTTFVSIDGGMSDNIRPALYGAKYEAIIANKANEHQFEAETVTICGKLCESGDRIIDGITLASPERGDTLCVFATGAYGYSMANNYNKMPKPAVALVAGADARLIVRRQTLAEMTACEL